MLNYKGYNGSVIYDGDDNIYHGKLIGITDRVSYEGKTIKGLEEGFQEAVDDYLRMCAEEGDIPQKP